MTVKDHQDWDAAVCNLRSGGHFRASLRVTDNRAVIFLLMKNTNKVPEISIVLNHYIPQSC